MAVLDMCRIMSLETVEFSLFFQENIFDLLIVFSKVLFPKLFDSLPPNTGTAYFKRTKKKPVGVPPHTVLGRKAADLTRAMLYAQGLCVLWTNGLPRRVQKNREINSTRNWVALRGVLSEQAKENPHWLASTYLTTLNQFSQFFSSPVPSQFSV